MGIAQAVLLAGVLQSRPCVVPDGLDHGVALLAGLAGFGIDEGFLHEAVQDIEDVVLIEGFARAHGLDGLEGASPGEHGEAAEEDLFLLGEEVVAPVHERLQGLLVGQAFLVRGAEEAEAVGEPRGDLLRVEQAQAGGGEFEGEGMPSKREQISATAAALPASSTKSGRTAFARSTKRRTASLSASRRARPGSLRGWRWMSKTPKGGTGSVVSPEIPRDDRLVARMRGLGEALRKSATSDATGRIRCSQLSRIRSISWRRRTSRRVSRAGRPGSSRRSREAMMADGTRSASVIKASSTSHTPPGKRPVMAAPASMASRVFPVPPVPVSVRRRVVPESCRVMVSSSVVRPMKLVDCEGRLFGSTDMLRGGGSRRGGLRR